MGKRLRKLNRLLTAWLVFLLIANAVALSVYLAGGGSLPELRDTLARAWDQRGHALDRLHGATAMARDATESFTEAWRRFWDGSARDQRAAVNSTGNIQVFFAPASPYDPYAIDMQLLAFLESAERSIYCAFYDLELESAADALIDQHRAGRDVRIVTDSDYRNRAGLLKCIQAGIPVTFDERRAFMHNKFAVVDGEWVWTGSANITRNGLYRNNNNSVLIASPHLAENYTVEFFEMFNGEFGPGSPANTPYPVIVLDDIRIESYFAPEDGVKARIIGHVQGARRSIDFMAFVFTSRPLAEAIAAQMHRGAQVRGILERRNAGSQYSQHGWLEEQGAEIHLDNNPAAMHHKVLILDARTVVTGSFNFSAAAEERNDENCLIIHCPEVAGRFLDEFDALLAL